jgi:hypothetical protein
LNQLFYAVFHSSGVTEIIRKIPCIKLPFNCGHDVLNIFHWTLNNHQSIIGPSWPQLNGSFIHGIFLIISVTPEEWKTA